MPKKGPKGLPSLSSLHGLSLCLHPLPRLSGNHPPLLSEQRSSKGLPAAETCSEQGVRVCMCEDRVSALNRRKGEVIFLVLFLMHDSSCCKPLSPPITSWSWISFTGVFSLTHFYSSSPLPHSLPRPVPRSRSLCCSLVMSGINVTTACFRDGTYHKVLRSNIQEHEKAFTVPLTCHKGRRVNDVDTRQCFTERKNEKLLHPHSLLRIPTRQKQLR